MPYRDQIPALLAASPHRCGIWPWPKLRFLLQAGFKLPWGGGSSSLLSAASAFTFAWCCPQAWHKGQCHPRCSHPVSLRVSLLPGCVAPAVQRAMGSGNIPAGLHPACEVQDAAGTSLLGCPHRATCNRAVLGGLPSRCNVQRATCNGDVPARLCCPMPGFGVPRRSALLLPQGRAPWTFALAGARSPQDSFSRSRGGWGKSRCPVRSGGEGVRAEIPPPPSFLLQRSCSQKAGRRLAACPPAS